MGGDDGVAFHIFTQNSHSYTYTEIDSTMTRQWNVTLNYSVFTRIKGWLRLRLMETQITYDMHMAVLVLKLQGCQMSISNHLYLDWHTNYDLLNRREKIHNISFFSLTDGCHWWDAHLAAWEHRDFWEIETNIIIITANGTR